MATGARQQFQRDLSTELKIFEVAGALLATGQYDEQKAAQSAAYLLLLCQSEFYLMQEGKGVWDRLK